jgi:hypothetical protein
VGLRLGMVLGVAPTDGDGLALEVAAALDAAGKGIVAAEEGVGVGTAHAPTTRTVASVSDDSPTSRVARRAGPDPLPGRE